MSTEKIIRNQAKQSLKGNWVAIISAVLFILTAIIGIALIGSLVLNFFETYDYETGETIKENRIAEIIVNFALIVSALFLSPLYSGLYRMFINTARYGKTDLSDFFYFFAEKQLYLKALIINFVSGVLVIGLGYGLNPYFYVNMATGMDINNITELSFDTICLTGSYIAGIVIKIFLYMIFVHYPILYLSVNEHYPLSHFTFKMYSFALKNFGKTFKLLFTFTGWIALCFFVVPAFYVLPYLGVSMANSAKWLFGINEYRG